MKKMLCLFLIICTFSFSSELNDIDNITNKYINDNVFPGAVVLVAKDSKILYKKAFGNSQVLENGNKKIRKMHTTTIFDLASLTKIFATTQAIMKLVTEKKLDINKPVSYYIPEFSKNGKEKVLVKDLLTHTSGLTPWLPIYYHASSKSEVLEYICNLPLEYPTNTARKYSDLSFMTLGFIIEKITNKPLNEYVLENIYKPLGLHLTRFLPLEVFSKNMIASTSTGNPFEMRMIKDPNFGYNIDEDFNSFRYWRNYTLTGQVNDGNSFYANHGVAGHAGLFSTVDDLYVLGEVILNFGEYKGIKMYSKDVVELFTSKQSEFGHGFGYEINRTGENSGYMGRFDDPKLIGHTGFTGTQFVYDLKNHLQVIILTNKQNLGVDENTKYKSTWKYAREVMNTVFTALELR